MHVLTYDTFVDVKARFDDVDTYLKFVQVLGPGRVKLGWEDRDVPPGFVYFEAKAQR